MPVAVVLVEAEHGEELFVDVHVPDAVGHGIEAGLQQPLGIRQVEEVRVDAEPLLVGFVDDGRIQLGRQGIGARILVESDGDPRGRLRRIAMDRTDLILTTSHGYTGLSDVACGNVTAYLADHAPCPLLIIRPEFRLGDMTQPGNSSDRMTAYELSH